MIGENVHVECVGEGPPLVLLHGFAMHSGLFAPIVPALAAKHRLYLVDLPGHGHSAPPRQYALDSMVATLNQAIELATFDVLGWSLGGAIALQWAGVHPDHVRRVVAVATSPAFVARPDWPWAMSAQTLQRFGDELRAAYELTLKRFLSLQVQGSDEGRATLAMMRLHLFERGRPSAEVLDGMLGLTESIDLRGMLRTVRQPVLVVSGDRDTLAPVEAGTWLARALPHASGHVVPGAAHVPFLSHTRAFLDLVEPFLDAR